MVEHQDETKRVEADIAQYEQELVTCKDMYENAKRLFYRAELDHKENPDRALYVLETLINNYNSTDSRQLKPENDAQSGFDGGIRRLLREIAKEHPQKVESFLLGLGGNRPQKLGREVLMDVYGDRLKGANSLEAATHVMEDIRANTFVSKQHFASHKQKVTDMVLDAIGERYPALAGKFIGDYCRNNGDMFYSANSNEHEERISDCFKRVGGEAHPKVAVEALRVAIEQSRSPEVIAVFTNTLLMVARRLGQTGNIELAQEAVQLATYHDGYSPKWQEEADTRLAKEPKPKVSEITRISAPELGPWR